MEVNNVEAEEILIGCFMNCNEDIYKFNDLTSDCFSDENLARYYEDIKKTIDEGLEYNLHYCKSFYNEDDYARLFTCFINSVASLPYGYVNLLKALKEKRSLSEISDDIKDRLSEVTPEDIMEKLSQAQTIRAKFKKQTNKQISLINADKFKQEHQVYPTNIKPIDLVFGGGLYPSKFYCIGARQKVGKTISLASIANNVSKNVPVLYIALEMGAEEINQRVLSFEAKLNSINFLKNPSELDDKLKERYYDALVKDKSQLDWIDLPEANYDVLKNMIIGQVKKYKYKVIVIDYLQIITGHRKGESEAEFQARVAQGLAGLVKQLGVTILTAAQLNRDGHLRGSDGLRNAVDLLVYLHRSDRDKNKRFLTTEASRYTMQEDSGSNDYPSLEISKHGPYLTEIID